MGKEILNNGYSATTIGLGEFSVAFVPAIQEKSVQPYSLGTIITDARVHIASRKKYHRHTISPLQAVDRILRDIPGARPENPREENARLHVGIPPAIDPEVLFVSLAGELPAHQSERREQIRSATHREYVFPLPENEPDRDTLQRAIDARLAAGGNPLRVYYDAAIALILQEWKNQDHIRHHTQLAASAADTEAAKNGADDAVIEHQEALHDDLPHSFSGEVYKVFP